MFLKVTFELGKSFIDKKPNDPHTQPNDASTILICKIINVIFQFESQINAVKIKNVLNVIF